MAADVVSVIERLVILQKAMPGINDAHPEVPLSLPAIPAWMNFVGAGVYDRKPHGNDLDVITRQFVMRLAVFPTTSGDSGEPEQKLKPWFETVRAYFDGYPTLNNLSAVRNAQIVGDSGPLKVTVAGTDYLGIDFRLQVIGLFKIIFKPGE